MSPKLNYIPDMLTCPTELFWWNFTGAVIVFSVASAVSSMVPGTKLNIWWMNEWVLVKIYPAVSLSWSSNSTQLNTFFIYFIMTDNMAFSFLIAWAPSQLIWDRHFELSRISPFYLTLTSSGSLQFINFIFLKLKYIFHPHYICISVQTFLLHYLFNVMYGICTRMCTTHDQLWHDQLHTHLGIPHLPTRENRVYLLPLLGCCSRGHTLAAT